MKEKERKKIVLASASPRRRELMKLLNMKFAVKTSDEEEVYQSTEPEEIVKELARQKAGNVAKHCKNSWVIGADTVVVIDGEILGKPKTTEEAISMILRLQGRSHQVYTGVAILETGENPECECLERDAHVERTDVTVWSMTEEEIREYVATGEPMDKAGGYGIQGAFAVYVKGIRGDYYNVVGFPIAYVAHKVKELVR